MTTKTRPSPSKLKPNNGIARWDNEGVLHRLATGHESRVTGAKNAESLLNPMRVLIGTRDNLHPWD